jgi:hypothetical protein
LKLVTLLFFLEAGRHDTHDRAKAISAQAERDKGSRQARLMFVSLTLFITGIDRPNPLSAILSSTHAFHSSIKARNPDMVEKQGGTPVLRADPAQTQSSRLQGRRRRVSRGHQTFFSRRS